MKQITVTIAGQEVTLPILDPAEVARAGCLACWMNCEMPIEEAVERFRPVPAQVHHPCEGSKRIHDKIFFALCLWHHSGKRPEYTPDFNHTAKILGPYVHGHKVEFEKRYGKPLSMLRLQVKVLAAMEGRES